MKISALWARRQRLAMYFLSFAATAAVIPTTAQTSLVAMTPDQQRNLGIETATLSAQQQGVEARYPGIIQLPPDQQHQITAPEDSIIQSVHVQEGVLVKKGTPLLVLTSQRLGELSVALIEQRSRLTLAERTAARDKTLFKDGIVAQRRVDESERALIDARAAYQQAASALAGAGLDEASIRELERGGRASNQVTLRAPIDGTVSAIQARPGARMTDNAPLLILIKRDQLWVDIQLPASHTSDWAPGDNLLLADGTEARVLSLGALSSTAQTRNLRAIIEAPPAHLLPGTIVQARLPIHAEKSWDLPLSAIARRDANAYVFVKTEQGFTPIAVDVASIGGQRAIVAGDLPEHAEVAVSAVVALKAAWLAQGDEE